jgi:hypothetical protein
MEGDDRWINNIFIKTAAPVYDIFEKANRPKRKEGTMGFGLAMYDEHPSELSHSGFPVSEMSNVKLPVKADGNVYINGAFPYKNGINELVFNDAEAEIRIEQKGDGIYLYLNPKSDFSKTESKIFNSFDFGEAMVPEVLFDNADGTPVLFDKDYFNAGREGNSNLAGPFSNLSMKNSTVKLWQK